MRYSLQWDGREYPIKENGLFEVLDAIERHVTLPELLAMQGSGRPNFSILARALHSMLAHAGVRNVPDHLELRRMMVAEGMSNIKSRASGEETTLGAAMSAVGVMTMLLMDGAPVGAEQPDDGKKKAKPLSKGATKSRSVNSE